MTGADGRIAGATVLGWIVALALGTAACSSEGAPPPAPPGQPVLLFVEAPSPVLEGSLLHVTGQSLELAVDRASLVVSTPASWVVLPLASAPDGSELDFSATRELIDSLGVGIRDVQVTLTGAARDSAPYDLTVNVDRQMPMDLTDLPYGDVHHNDEVVFAGYGFLSPGEGTVTAVFDGTFTNEDGMFRSVHAELPVLPLERFARDRGVAMLSTTLGGIQPGTFDGNVRLDSTLVGGATASSATLFTSLYFGPPVLFAVEPAVVSLEQLFSVRGAGFVGQRGASDQATLIRIRGTFAPEGEVPREVGPTELVLEYVSGNEMRGALESEADNGRLVSRLFGAARGEFHGWANPITIDGSEEVEGPASPFTLTVAQVRQVVLLRFLSGFYDSLERFGLTVAEGVIEARVAERIESIYAGLNVDVRLDEPTDVSRNGYAVVEIGGPDPNNRGLFGYDNTPGKDVHNLRLYDAIGGANVDSQADGTPGYGGVFIENFLFFSSHPGLARPAQGPTADPLFDEIFDAVRQTPATAAEVVGMADAARSGAVERAIRALASMVGETTAHELGHSLGMAEPFARRSDVFHSCIPGEGCLMDSGGDRPLGERVAEPGFAVSRICGTDTDYLDYILGSGTTPPSTRSVCDGGL